MTCVHTLDWNGCKEHKGCEVASCEPCNRATHLTCSHKVIGWLHNERVIGCEDCDNATEYEQGELTPCSLIVCVACKEFVEAATQEHHEQLFRGA